MINYEKLVNKFFANINERESKDKCWEWQGKLMTSGYGLIKVGFWKGPNYYVTGAHRFSYIMHHGEEAPEGMYVCHTCDNKKCVNPFHFFLGTSKDNQFDCNKKGRGEFRRQKLLSLSKVRKRNSLGRFV